MKISEIINLKLGTEDTFTLFKKLDLELIENTPEEISAVTIEMHKRIKGNWESNEEDIYLQRQFWLLCGSKKLKCPNLRIGAEFLRNNKNLL